jgi:hypothetical protein
MLAGQVWRERIKGCRKLECLQRGVIELHRAAAASYFRLIERAVGVDADLNDRVSLLAYRAARRTRIVNGSNVLHLTAPAIEVGRELGGLGVRRGPELIPLRAA